MLQRPTYVSRIIHSREKAIVENQCHVKLFFQEQKYRQDYGMKTELGLCCATHSHCYNSVLSGPPGRYYSYKGSLWLSWHSAAKMCFYCWSCTSKLNTKKSIKNVKRIFLSPNFTHPARSGGRTAEPRSAVWWCLGWDRRHRCKTPREDSQERAPSWSSLPSTPEDPPSVQPAQTLGAVLPSCWQEKNHTPWDFVPFYLQDLKHTGVTGTPCFWENVNATPLQAELLPWSHR